MDSYSIAAGGMRASVLAKGAELSALHGAGADVLWPGEAPWLRHAPNLFPIVGRLQDDTLRHDGATYRLTQHGFARDRVFDWTRRDADGCTLVLRDDAATRALYPFPFVFEIDYAITGDRLDITFRVENPGAGVLPASFGAHPAFRWPLRPEIDKTAHSLTFAQAEPAAIRRVAGGLLLAERFASPVEGCSLPLHDGLFAADAIILEQPASRWVRYTAPGAPVVEVSWDDGFPSLGIWSRPDAALLCIEPWHGMSSPAGWDGEFMDKPGIMQIEPGGSRTARHSIRVTPPA